MACACKVNQQIARLQKEYGDRNRRSSEPVTHISDDIRTAFKKLLTWLVVLPLIPLMVIYIIVRRVRSEKKEIHVDDFLRIIRRKGKR